MNYWDDDEIKNMTNVMYVLKEEETMVEVLSLEEHKVESRVLHEFLSVSQIIFESHAPFSKKLDLILIPSSLTLYPPSFLISPPLNDSYDHITNVHIYTSF